MLKPKIEAVGEAAQLATQPSLSYYMAVNNPRIASPVVDKVGLATTLQAKLTSPN